MVVKDLIGQGKDLVGQGGGLMQTTLDEFRSFIARGNVMDLAVGVIVGAAFSKIVESLVGDVIMPIVGLAFGKLDFSNLFIVLGEIPPGTPRTLAALKREGVGVLAYGSFLTVALNFIILSFIVFMMVRQVQRLRAAAELAEQKLAEKVGLRSPAEQQQAEEEAKKAAAAAAEAEAAVQAAAQAAAQTKAEDQAELAGLLREIRDRLPPPSKV